MRRFLVQRNLANQAVVKKAVFQNQTLVSLGIVVVPPLNLISESLVKDSEERRKVSIKSGMFGLIVLRLSIKKGGELSAHRLFFILGAKRCSKVLSN